MTIRRTSYISRTTSYIEISCLPRIINNIRMKIKQKNRFFHRFEREPPLKWVLKCQKLPTHFWCGWYQKSHLLTYNSANIPNFQFQFQFLFNKSAKHTYLHEGTKMIVWFQANLSKCCSFLCSKVRIDIWEFFNVQSSCRRIKIFNVFIHSINES